MRVAEYKQIGVKTEQFPTTVIAEYYKNGELITESYESSKTVMTPIYGTVYRDATPEELAQMQQ